VVGADVRDQAVDLLGRGADAAFGRHVQVAHAPIMPERPQPCSAAAAEQTAHRDGAGARAGSGHQMGNRWFSVQYHRSSRDWHDATRCWTS
jgi:hypothetical protein